MYRNINMLNGYCSGCSACKIICPVDAIEIERNDLGFFEAKVFEKKCINCGKCTNVCLKSGVKDAKNLTEGKMISAQSKNSKTVMSCTSGGIAYELSCYAVENGWTIVGVVYDFEQNIAKTVLANSLEEIEEFKGSKYIQSYCADGFGTAVEMAKADSNKKFLAFGTPCQIYGLAAVLENSHIRKQFVLVDLFCHGVPSYLLWDEYLKSVSSKLGNKKLTKVIFRDKSIGWHNFVMHLESENGTYCNSSEGDLFYHAFFDNVLFCDSCFECDIRKKKTKADIRLGDYWGKRYQLREDGVSAVLLMTEEGEKFFSHLSSVQVLERTTVEEVLEGQSVHTYKTKELSANAIEELKETGNLKITIRHYRKQFSKKARVKLFLKELTAHLPDSLRAKIRYLYRRI